MAIEPIERKAWSDIRARRRHRGGINGRIYHFHPENWSSDSPVRNIWLKPLNK